MKCFVCEKYASAGHMRECETVEINGTKFLVLRCQLCGHEVYINVSDGYPPHVPH